MDQTDSHVISFSHIPASRWIEGCNTPNPHMTLGGHNSTQQRGRDEENNTSKNKTNNKNMVQLQAQPTSKASASITFPTCVTTKDRL
jgi:hypothetical protein